ncbi:hypothetical protein [Mucisphaera sp.]|uniref:hypothetical protein n=1 Tax=Mucisphaera sp. TaxID=2913024 RepID=UPI003D0C971D
MPKQRINTPFVLMLVGALVLVIGGASAFYFLAVYQDPASRVVEARQHLDNGDYRLAIEQLVAATKAEPTNIEYQNLLFDALRASPVADIPQANKRLGELRTIRRNVATLRLSDPEAQRAHYAFLNELRRDLDPGFVNVMYNEANERLQSVESDTVALKYRGIASVLRFARGVADADERQQARVDLNAALEADPNDGESLHALATWLMLEAERIARVAAADPEIERLRSEAGTVLDRLIEAAGDDIGLKLDYVSLAILPEAQRRSNAVEVFNEVEQQLLNAGGSRSNALTVLNILGRGSGGGRPSPTPMTLAGRPPPPKPIASERCNSPNAWPNWTRKTPRSACVWPRSTEPRASPRRPSPRLRRSAS